MPKPAERRPAKRRRARRLPLVEETGKRAEDHDGSCLGPVTGVDADVAFGEIAGPETGFTLSVALHLETDQALFLIQFLFQCGCGELRRKPAYANRHALQRYVHLRRIELDAGVTGG